MKNVVTFLVVVFLWIMWSLASSCFSQERYPLETYRDYGKDTESWSVSPPKIYSSDGTYLGELSKNRYAPDSISNPYGRFGSKYSSDSINNRYGTYGRYRATQLYVYPRW